MAGGAHHSTGSHERASEPLTEAQRPAILLRELERRGVRDQVEVRAIDRRVHAKNALIDGQFLIIGSQNYHYSAFGPGAGLAEYSLGVDDPRAVEAYRRMYDYYWERARALDRAPVE